MNNVRIVGPVALLIANCEEGKAKGLPVALLLEFVVDLRVVGFFVELYDFVRMANGWNVGWL